MAEQLHLHPNVILMPEGGGVLRLFQAAYRRNMNATLPVMGLIDLLQAGTDADTLRRAYDEAGAALRWADATEFTIWDHVFRNPDLYAKAPDDALEHTDFDEFLEVMLDCGMVTDVWPPVFDFEKRSFGDRFRGSYHQQIGTECLFNRTEPAQWWTRQKFEPDMRAMRDTPYRHIEEHFLDGYFAENVGGLDVLEIGCGTGYFTERIARHARKAVGMDYNPDYVATAREKFPGRPNLEFHVGDIIDLADGFPGAPFDRVVLIDTFLFLFDRTFQPLLTDNRNAIMDNIRKLVKPGGQLLVMDPHPFWLTAWGGDESVPFGVISEYRTRWFKSSPSLQEVSDLLYETGWRIRRIVEPQISDDYREVDPRGWAFMRQFPQWWFFEAEPS